MKFGKQLLLKQKKQWSQSYINYKAAKKIIKKLRQSLPKDWDPTKLSAPIEETYSKEFFDLLNQELQKIKEFYAEKEQRVVEEFSRLKSSQKETRFIYEDALELSEKIAALNDYVTLNVTGFSKILKKHDKHLKANTKKKYLQKVFSLDMVKNHTLDDLESQIHVSFSYLLLTAFLRHSCSRPFQMRKFHMNQNYKRMKNNKQFMHLLLMSWKLTSWNHTKSIIYGLRFPKMQCHYQFNFLFW
jgi:SPX domain protein involved in polyphosphate accumulation